MPINSVPTRDGQIGEYVSGEASESGWFDHKRGVVFINGMSNSGRDHVNSALKLSVMQMCKVYGVYNKSSDWAKDIAQCLMDKMQFDGPGALSAAGVRNQVRDNRKQELVQAMESVLQRNPACISTFRLLRSPEGRKMAIFAHSQGNLILANALSAIQVVDGVDSLKDKQVHAFGSPTLHWPSAVKPQEYGFTWDPVSWLAGPDLSLSISKVGMPQGSLNPVTHGFLEYVKRDPAFIINRFRWGSLGLTVSMDEEGLADALVQMGKNIPRVYSVFERLQRRHKSDVDDVALLYVEKLRRAPIGTSVLQGIEMHGKLRDLLTKAMETGWTSGKEKRAISHLKSLKRL